MNKNFSDEQLDQILRKAVEVSTADKELLDEIAASPKIWRNVQSRIEREKSRRGKFWIPPWLDWRIAAFAAMFFVVCSGLFFLLKSRENNLAAIEKSPENSSVEARKIFETPEITDLKKINKEIDSSRLKISSKTVSNKSVSPQKEIKQNNFSKPKREKKTPRKSPEIVTKTDEIKTDFIALAYTAAPESGQILKVKVPRSMMVSLGVINKTENGSELVNAEVLLGVDGSAHAIRFTR